MTEIETSRLCPDGNVFSQFSQRCVVNGSEEDLKSADDPEGPFEPVCGCDGKTYPSVRAAWGNGVTFTRPGNCSGRMTYQLLHRHEPVQIVCEATYRINDFDRGQLCDVRGIKQDSPCNKLHDSCYMSAPKSCAKGSSNWDLFPKQLRCAYQK